MLLMVEICEIFVGGRGKKGYSAGVKSQNKSKEKNRNYIK